MLAVATRHQQRTTRTHRLALAEDSNDEEGFAEEEDDEEDQGRQLVQRVERVRLVGCGEGVVPVVGPAESSVERNVARADE